MKETKIVRDGLCERYDKSEHLTASWFQKDGFKDGEYKTFYVNGQLNEHCFYVNGHVHGVYIKHYKTGTLEKTVSYFNNGRVDGIETMYFKNGNRDQLTNYVNGFLHGKYQTFHKNGSICVDTNFRNGKRNGVNRWFFDNGQLEYIEHYIDSSKDGIYEVYRKDGTMKESGRYKNGSKCDLIKIYDEDGILSRMSFVEKYNSATVYPFSRLEEVSKTMYQAWKNKDFDILKSLSIIENIKIDMNDEWFLKS